MKTLVKVLTLLILLVASCRPHAEPSVTRVRTEFQSARTGTVMQIRGTVKERIEMGPDYPFVTDEHEWINLDREIPNHQPGDKLIINGIVRDKLSPIGNPIGIETNIEMWIERYLEVSSWTNLATSVRQETNTQQAAGDYRLEDKEKSQR